MEKWRLASSPSLVASPLAAFAAAGGVAAPQEELDTNLSKELELAQPGSGQWHRSGFIVCPSATPPPIRPRPPLQTALLSHTDAKTNHVGAAAERN